MQLTRSYMSRLFIADPTYSHPLAPEFTTECEEVLSLLSSHHQHCFGSFHTVALPRGMCIIVPNFTHYSRNWQVCNQLIILFVADSARCFLMYCSEVERCKITM